MGGSKGRIQAALVGKRHACTWFVVVCVGVLGRKRSTQYGLITHSQSTHAPGLDVVVLEVGTLVQEVDRPVLLNGLLGWEDRRWMDG